MGEGGDRRGAARLALGAVGWALVMTVWLWAPRLLWVFWPKG